MLTVSLTATDAQCFDIDDGTITTVVAGGTPNYTFSWSDISTDQDRLNLAGGTYTVTVTDNNGCTVVDSVTVNQGSEIIPNVTSIDISCTSTNDGSAFARPTGGTLPYTYLWGPGTPTGQGTDSISGLTAGDYRLTLTDNNGCDTVVRFTVNQGVATFTITETVNDISCNGANDGIAHFAHVGGAIVGFILVKFWKMSNLR